MRTAARLCLVALALWTTSCGGTPSATPPVTGEGNATLTTGPTTSPSSTPAASVTPQPTAPPTATLAPATPTPAPTDLNASSNAIYHSQIQKHFSTGLWLKQGADVHGSAAHRGARRLT